MSGGGAAIPAPAGRALIPAFVGREQALSTVVEALERRPALVLIDGEAGIGKTRLLYEAVARAGCGSGSGRDGETPPGARRVLMTTCPPYGEPLTLGPIVDAVRQARDGVAGLPLSPLAGALRPLYPEWAADLPPMPERLEDAKASRHRLFRALAELIGCLDVSVLVVEDAHWADDATLEFLLYLTSQREGGRDLCLIVTSRPQEVPADSLLRRLPAGSPQPGTGKVRLALPPLGVPETAELISSMLDGEPVSAQFATFLHERTGGIPLAVEESVRLMRDRADVVRHEGEWIRRSLAELRVPPTVREVVLQRLRRLAPATTQVLRAVAVLAEPSGESMLGAVTGLDVDQVGSGMGEALAAGLLGEDARGQVVLRHALMRQAVYEAIPARERRRLHRAAGMVLEGADPPPAAQLARHFREANDVGRWCRYAEQAADQAVAADDHLTAGTLLNEVLAAPELTLPDRARLAGKAGTAALHTQSVGGNLHRLAVMALRAVLDSPDLGHRDRAGLHILLGRLLLQQDDAAGNDELEHALSHPGLDPVQAALAMTKLGQPDKGLRPAAVHLRWLQRAAEVPDAAMTPTDRLGLTIDRANALLNLGQATGWAAAAALPTEATNARERLQLARGHLNIGESAIRWGRYADARRLLDAAWDLADAHQFARIRDMARAKLARLEWLTGDWTDLRTWIPSAARDDDIEPLARPEILLVAGLLLAAHGERRRATQVLTDLLDQERREGHSIHALEPAAALGRLWLAEGRLDDALKVTDQPMQAVVTRGIWISATDIAPVRVAVLLSAARLAEADELVTRFARGLRGCDAPAPRAALAECRALLVQHEGEPARAAAAFARAAQLWRRLPRPYDALLARERQARGLLADGGSTPALAMLSEVFHGLAGLGARGDADRIAHELHRHGMSVLRPWRGRPGYGDRLSPRELEIVRLVAAGRTNAQIARALSKSQPTVSTQLHSAMRKLGVSSRTALAVRAIAEGLVQGLVPAEGGAGAGAR